MLRRTIFFVVAVVSSAWAAPSPRLNVRPREVLPGRRTLTLRLLNQDGSPLRNFELLHEREQHLIVIGPDASGELQFQHRHPVIDDRTGTSKARVQFEAPGTSSVFLEAKPVGEATIVGHALVMTQGRGVVPRALTPSLGPIRRGNFQATLLTSNRIEEGRPVQMVVDIRSISDKPAKLGEYLGALGHAVVYVPDRDTISHLHAGHNLHGAQATQVTSHPSPSGHLVFEHTFGEPGVHPLWVQTKIGSVVYKFRFDVAVDFAAKAQAQVEPPQHGAHGSPTLATPPSTPAPGATAPLTAHNGH